MDQRTTRDFGVYVGTDISTCDDPADMSEGFDNTLRLEIEILSNPAELERVRQAAEDFAIRIGMDEASVGRVVLALDEALTNIIRHAYEGAKDQPIEIALTCRDGKLTIMVRDYGRVVHPSAIHSRDLDDIRPGGLGVHIMNECMDEVDFSADKAGVGTVLTMTKRI